MLAIRQADLTRDRDEVARLWLEFLTWGNDELQARLGFQLGARTAVEGDLATVSKYQPPDGRLLLAFEHDTAIGVGCLKRIGVDTAEIKRMYVDPRHRRAGVGHAILDELLSAARAGGYARVRLDSPRFMTAAHALYRSRAFRDIEPYPESEIPEQYRAHWIFMELPLR